MPGSPKYLMSLSIAKTDGIASSSARRDVLFGENLETGLFKHTAGHDVDEHSIVSSDYGSVDLLDARNVEHNDWNKIDGILCS